VPRSVLDRGDSTAEPIYVPPTDFTPWKGIGFDTRERAVESRAGVPLSRRLDLPLVRGQARRGPDRTNSTAGSDSRFRVSLSSIFRSAVTTSGSR
jgi:hypothetical protein